MPIQRFRDFDEARRALWLPADDPTLHRRIRGLWEFWRRLSRSSMPRGVRRFRTIEEANADRDQWVDARIRTLARERGTMPR
jgi:hypothetical protein